MHTVGYHMSCRNTVCGHHRGCALYVSQTMSTCHTGEWTTKTLSQTQQHAFCIVSVLLAPTVSWNALNQHYGLIEKRWSSKDCCENPDMLSDMLSQTSSRKCCGLEWKQDSCSWHSVVHSVVIYSQRDCAFTADSFSLAEKYMNSESVKWVDGDL